MVGNLAGQALAVVAVGARQRHQVLHGGVSADPAQAHLLLNRGGQIADQRQAPGHPGDAAIETVRQLLQAQPRAGLQFAQQPSLLERRFAFGLAQRPVQYQGLRLVHVPARGPHRVALEPSQGPHPLVAVNDQEAARFARQGDHHDRDLLPSFGQLSQQASLPLRRHTRSPS